RARPRLPPPALRRCGCRRRSRGGGARGSCRCPAGSTRRCTARSARLLLRHSWRQCSTSSQDALVADAPGEPVGVEALEQQLRGLTAHTEQVAEPCERDPPRRLALADELGARLAVGRGRHGIAVADADTSSLLL